MRKHAFSLVELSIVLVILGLLVGGVLSGQSLIRAAELRRISTGFTKYHAAVMTFEDKYFAMPGDMPNATAFWGIAGGTGSDATCLATISTSTATCNGDGDEKILPSTGSLEPYRAWQHLANGGLIEGSYTGASSAATNSHTDGGVNVPNASVSSGWFQFAPLNSSGSAIARTGEIDGKLFFLGAAGYGSGRTPPPHPVGGVLKNEEVWNIDTKLDDGVADTGKIRGNIIDPSSLFLVQCAPYDLSNTASLCNVAYIF